MMGKKSGKFWCLETKFWCSDDSYGHLGWFLAYSGHTATRVPCGHGLGGVSLCVGRYVTVQNVVWEQNWLLTGQIHRNQRISTYGIPLLHPSSLGTANLKHQPCVQWGRGGLKVKRSKTSSIVLFWPAEHRRVVAGRVGCHRSKSSVLAEFGWICLLMR